MQSVYDLDGGTLPVKAQSKILSGSRTSTDEMFLDAYNSQKEKDDAKVSKDAKTALNKSVREKLNRYLMLNPKYKVISQQIEILKEKSIEYRKAGDKEKYETCKLELDSLLNIKKKYKSIVTGKTSDEKAEARKAIDESPVIAELKDKRAKLNSALLDINTNSLVSRVKKVRERLELLDKANDMSLENIVDIEELDELDTSENEFEVEYDKLLELISERTDIPVNKLESMGIGQIRKALKETEDAQYEQTIKDLNDQLLKVKYSIGAEQKRLSGDNDVTDVMFDIFDYSTAEDEPKDMLAAAHVPFVEAVAYKQCSRLNMMHYESDAIAYGLLGLSKAINNWYEIQKPLDNPLPFSSYAYTFVVNTIKRGLLELSSGGMYSGSTKATIDHYNKQRAELVRNNPEFAGFSEDIVEALIDSEDVHVASVITEGAYTGIIGGDDDKKADIWANATSGNSDADTDIENEMEYNSLVDSIKALVNEFEWKEEKTANGESVWKKTNKKLLDKYDWELFQMLYGIKKWKDENGEEHLYTQEQIADALQKLYALNGINKTFKQSAISSRKKELEKKVVATINHNPKLKKAFAFFMYNIQTNKESFNRFSTQGRENGVYDLDDSAFEQVKVHVPRVNQREINAVMRAMDNFVPIDMSSFSVTK